MTSALHGWQAVLARFEQRRKRQRAEHHEERASSLRLVVAKSRIVVCEFQHSAKTKGKKFYFINALWSVKKRAPACSQSSLFCLLSTEGWVLRNTNITNDQALTQLPLYFSLEALLANDVHQLLKFYPLFHYFIFSPREQEEANYKPDMFKVLVLANYVH